MTSQQVRHIAEFSVDQEALLNDLTRNGALDQDHMFGDAGMGADANGFAPYQDFNYTDTYPDARLANGFQDLADSATLLESLSDLGQHLDFLNDPYYDYNSINENSVSDDGFAGLLESAATAVGGDATRVGQEQIQAALVALPSSPADGCFGHDNVQATSVTLPRPPTDGFFKRSFLPELRSKRQQSADSSGQSTDDGEKGSKNRKKLSEEELASERDLWGSDDDSDDQNYEEEKETESEDAQPASEPSLSNADLKQAGVKSATALFKRPSKASRKYSRPLMSKMYLSLELEPEPFLYLQGAAKKYMLDEDHPERSECIGHRGNTKTVDSDVTKLKMYGIVKAFLQDEGWGERCFGLDAPGASTRKLIWPKHEHKIIALCTPLLRRMVSNERQRLYSLAQRKRKLSINTEADDPRKRKRSATSVKNTPSPTNNTPEPTSKPSEAKSPVPFDPRFGNQHSSIEASMPSYSGTIIATQTSMPSKSGNIGAAQQVASTPGTRREGSPDQDLKYHINILQDGRRIKPRVTLEPSRCCGFSSLVQQIERLVDRGLKPKGIQVVGPNGRIDVDDEDSWKWAITAVKKYEWMDGDVKCLVELEKVA